jgi:hypothetical protein
MNNVEVIEQQIEKPSPHELAALAEKAIRVHTSG